MPDILGFASSEPLAIDVLQHFVVNGVFAGAVLEHERFVALGLIAGRQDIRLGAGPPSANDLVTRVGDRCGFLNGRRIHDAPAPQEHVIWTILPYLQPLRLLLDARVGHGDQ